MSYEVRSRDLSGISNSGPYCVESYQNDVKYYTMDRYTLCGYVLIKTKQIAAGFELKFRFSTRGYFEKKPQLSKLKRWKVEGFKFYWLNFGIMIEPKFREVPDMVVMDHWGDLQDKENPYLLIPASLKGCKIKTSRWGYKYKILC